MSILNLQGAHENELVATGEFNQRATKTAFMLPNGQRVVLPTELLLQALEGRVDSEPGYGIDRSAKGVPATAPETAANEMATDEQVIALVQEEMVVGKREVETGRVRLRKETVEHVESVSVPLTETRWEIEHVSMEQMVDAPPDIRRVGETTIFSLVEERLVVKRELWLREEVHVRKVSSTVEKSADFALKRDVLIEDRTDQV